MSVAYPIVGNATLVTVDAFLADPASIRGNPHLLDVTLCTGVSPELATCIRDAPDADLVGFYTTAKLDIAAVEALIIARAEPQLAPRGAPLPIFFVMCQEEGEPIVFQYIPHQHRARMVYVAVTPGPPATYRENTEAVCLALGASRADADVVEFPNDVCGQVPIDVGVATQMAVNNTCFRR